MFHSTVTMKGQTTIPGAVREALRIEPGDKLEYSIEGNQAVIRVHPGTRSLKARWRVPRAMDFRLPRFDMRPPPRGRQRRQ